MCYSTLIKANLKKLALEFGAKADLESFSRFYALRLEHPELKAPFGLDRYFVLSQDAQEQKLAPLIRKFHEAEAARAAASIADLEREMKELRHKPTSASKKKIEVRERKIEKLKQKLDASFDRISPLDERIFPGSFAPVVIAEGKGRRLLPMRYRVRRPDGGEVPSQYNVFHARRDSLLPAPTWKPLFGHTHAIFPFARFYEWITDEHGKKKEIAFSPAERGMMWAASLYSPPRSRQMLPYASFAMVTDDPPPEVAAAGHDRCPIFLRSTAMDAWLHPQKIRPQELLGLLGEKEKAFYINSLAA
jgi:putative SOS response-associated peptidase YedK